MSTKKNNLNKKNFYMKLALNQAYKALGNTGVNPAVGCVIVKNKCIIGSGYTGLNGTPHAEVNAIKSCKEDVKNSHLYSTLEPCSHFGKTPPCVNFIIRKKIKKVFFSLKDPDLRSFDQSKNIFKKNNIISANSILLKKIKSFYRSYLKETKCKIPYIVAKLATSKDYYTVNKKSKWITNFYSRSRVQIIRTYFDSILTSSKTIIKDNSRLNCRIKGLKHLSPTRIILDKRLEVPKNSNIIKLASKNNTIIFYNKINVNKIKYFKSCNIKLIWFPLNTKNDFDIEKVLMKIKKLGFNRLLLESGKNLTTYFIKNNLVDSFILFKSNKILGYNGINNFKKSINFISKYKKEIINNVNLFGDKLIIYYIK